MYLTVLCISSLIYNIGLVMASEKVYIATMKPSVSSVSTPHIWGDITKIFDGDSTTTIVVDRYYLPLTIEIDLGRTIPVNTLELSKLTESFFNFSFKNIHEYIHFLQCKETHGMMVAQKHLN